MQYLIIILGLIWTGTTIAAASSDTPVGYWKTIDDKTGQVLSIVSIQQQDHDLLTGKIVAIMPVLGQKATDTCQKCRGELQNKPILGMMIIGNMKKLSSQQWGDGWVLDPKSGNTYHAQMELIANNQKLKLRGYIGIPLFGRSQVWVRTKGLKQPS